jgi:ABC-type oligopeptide transport system substrate-binding subunit
LSPGGVDEGAARVSPAEASDGGVLRIAVAGVTSLDPALANPASPSQAIVADLLYDGLTAFDASTNRVVGAVARAWSISADGLTWTFELDPDARFSDGRPVAAVDVKSTLERVAALGVKSVAGVRLAAVDGYDEFVANPAAGLRGIATTDVGTVSVHLRTPMPSLDELLTDPSFGIVPQGTMSDPSSFGVNAATSGPFRIESRDGDTITARRRDGARTALSGVTLRLVADAAAAHALFRAGEVDLAVLGADEVADANARGELVLSAPQQVSLFYGMNVKSPALSSPAMRRAIVKAVDRESLRRELFGDTADVMNGLFGPGIAAARSNACSSACTYDADGARAIVAQAYPSSGEPTVHVDYYDEPSGREAKIAQRIVDDLRTAGIPAEVRSNTFEAYGKRLTDGSAELFRFGWVGAYPAAEEYVEPLFSSTGSDNVFSVADTDLDGVLAKARTERDDKTRTSILMSAEDRVLALDVLLPLVRYRTHLVATANVHDVVLGPNGSFDAERISLS